jgi:hypothetical protein
MAKDSFLTTVGQVGNYITDQVKQVFKPRLTRTCEKCGEEINADDFKSLCGHHLPIVNDTENDTAIHIRFVEVGKKLLPWERSDNNALLPENHETNRLESKRAALPSKEAKSHKPDPNPYTTKDTDLDDPEVDIWAEVRNKPVYTRSMRTGIGWRSSTADIHRRMDELNGEKTDDDE